jgi:hypothetical protein
LGSSGIGPFLRLAEVIGLTVDALLVDIFPPVPSGIQALISNVDARR